jgi:hypothetical protein
LHLAEPPFPAISFLFLMVIVSPPVFGTILLYLAFNLTKKFRKNTLRFVVKGSQIHTRYGKSLLALANSLRLGTGDAEETA